MTILQVLAAILAALLLLAAAAGSGPAAAQAVPSLGDASITARVERALDNERSLEHANVSVTTEDGVVNLSGTVKSKAERSKASAVATKVEGVKKVKNDLKVE